MFGPYLLKKEFPIFSREINGKILTYLDNASTSQKPIEVINALEDYYKKYNANIHRGIHLLAEEATLRYEQTRNKIVGFINAGSSAEIIFTRNATEAINLVAYSWGEQNINKDDEIIVSALEHHSNFVPWQMLAKRKQAKLKIIPLKEDFTLDMEAYKSFLSPKTKLIAITGMSNVLGTIPNIKEIISHAHKVNAITLIDGAQMTAHMPTDVQNLDCDFLVFSAHKMLGPTGVGVLYGKREILEKMPPFIFGGDMIKEVTVENTTWNDLPYKFEGGTPNIADVIAFGKAIDYLEEIGMKNVFKHSQKILEYATQRFSQYKKVKIFLPKNLENSGPVLSFTIEGVHPHDIASIFNDHGVCIRSGHHCAEPLMKDIGADGGTARMSFYLYNTEEDIDRAETALKDVFKIFKIEN